MKRLLWELYNHLQTWKLYKYRTSMVSFFGMFIKGKHSCYISCKGFTDCCCIDVVAKLELLELLVLLDYRVAASYCLIITAGIAAAGSLLLLLLDISSSYWIEVLE
ncbi:hypothetical protein PTKIN_Ptkin05aG0134900 [Pterospermum kingtungense]